MTNILEKKGDNLTRAINYIDAGLKSKPDVPLHKRISEAGARFNLTPKDEEYLTRFFKRGQEPSP